jgi:hypothetical protein
VWRVLQWLVHSIGPALVGARFAHGRYIRLGDRRWGIEMIALHLRGGR